MTIHDVMSKDTSAIAAASISFHIETWKIILFAMTQIILTDRYGNSVQVMVFSVCSLELLKYLSYQRLSHICAYIKLQSSSQFIM